MNENYYINVPLYLNLGNNNNMLLLPAKVANFFPAGASEGAFSHPLKKAFVTVLDALEPA